MGKEEIIKNLVDILISKKLLNSKDRSDFEQSVMNQIFNINQDQHDVNTSTITPEQLMTCHNTFNIRKEIIKVFEKEFNKVEVLESYGEQFFKIRIPPNDHSLGYMYGFMESNKQESWKLT